MVKPETPDRVLESQAWRLIHNPPGDNKLGGPMRMKFTLNMEDLVVEGNEIDNMVVDWVEDVTQERVLEISNLWISSQTFLTEKMDGLSKVGESSLTIEPMEE